MIDSAAERADTPMRIAAAPALLAVFALALLLPGVTEPIVENYVGRQIPTAMVARNLERGSGFFSPQLDTGPFPNLFLVEPPIYAQTVVAFRRVTGLPLMAAGRIVSGLSVVLAIWGLFGLARRRMGLAQAMGVGLIFLKLPVVLRYGRAFQPDAMMMGLMIGGLRCWDDAESEANRWKRLLGVFLIATGLATKIIAAYFLIPLIFVIVKPRRLAKIFLILSTLLPAIGWYAYAAWRLRTGAGSRASADNAEIWMRVVSLEALARSSTYVFAAKFLIYKCFTPIGIGLAIFGAIPSWGMWREFRDRFQHLLAMKPPEKTDHLWWVWTLSASSMLVLLAGKAHHEYYWIALAPVVAVWGMIGADRAVWFLFYVFGIRNKADGLAKLLSETPLPAELVDAPRAAFRVLPILFAFLLIAVIPYHYDPTPPEWAAWGEAVAAIHASVPEGTLLAAPEALLFLGDRKGCRLEYEPRSAVRAAGEWGGKIEPDDPLALLEFYRSKNARFVCDLWPVGDEPNRRALHDAIRGRYNVITDRDGVLLAEMIEKR